MKIEKLPSGSYRVRKTVKGKTYSVVFNEKPTQKEILQALADAIGSKRTASDRTFEALANQYIDLKRNILSPATVREYSRYCNRLPAWFIKLKTFEIDDIQRCVNELSATLAPKTVKDLYSFIVAVLKHFYPSMNIYASLPQKVKYEPYIPTDEDVKRILDYSKDNQYYLPLLLACCSLRRSEICALESSDLEGNVLTINKALVQNENKEWIVKITKTTESTRKILVTDEIACLIKEKDGRVFEQFPNTISNYLKRTQHKLGMKEFSIHKLRHYYASSAHTLGIPDSYIQKTGGWKNNNTLKQIYTHAQTDKEIEMQQKYLDHLNKLQ